MRFLLKNKLFTNKVTLEEMRQRVQKELGEGICIIGPDFDLVPLPDEWVKAAIANPKVYEDIIFCDKNKIEYIGTFNNFNQFVDRSGEVIEDVVAWMPTPLPFEE